MKKAEKVRVSNKKVEKLNQFLRPLETCQLFFVPRHFCNQMKLSNTYAAGGELRGNSGFQQGSACRKIVK